MYPAWPSCYSSSRGTSLATASPRRSPEAEPVLRRCTSTPTRDRGGTSLRGLSLERPAHPRGRRLTRVRAPAGGAAGRAGDAAPPASTGTDRLRALRAAGRSGGLPGRPAPGAGLRLLPAGQRARRPGREHSADAAPLDVRSSGSATRSRAAATTSPSGETWHWRETHGATARADQGIAARSSFYGPHRHTASLSPSSRCRSGDHYPATITPAGALLPAAGEGIVGREHMRSPGSALYIPGRVVTAPTAGHGTLNDFPTSMPARGRPHVNGRRRGIYATSGPLRAGERHTRTEVRPTPCERPRRERRVCVPEPPPSENPPGDTLRFGYRVIC